jgi:uncharacterized protein (DUF2141 family)
MRSLVLALALGSPVLAVADAPANGLLILRASGFTHARGHALAKLFAPGDNVLGAGRWQLSAPIENGFAEFRFSQLPTGSYAVVVFHDENDNGKIDHGLLGPSEPLGFSGDFALSLLSGRPNFERLKFSFQAPEQTLEVRVR